MRNIKWLSIVNIFSMLMAIALIFFGDRLFKNLSSAWVSPPTPTSLPDFKVLVKQPSFCYNGPSENYQIAAAVIADTVVDPLAVNGDGNGWFLIQGKEIGRCWIKTSLLKYEFDPALIPIIPTASTKTEVPCYTRPRAFLEVQTIIPEKWRLVVNAKEDLGADWVLITPHDTTTQCWVARSMLTEFDYKTLPVVSIPNPTQTPTPSLVAIFPTINNEVGTPLAPLLTRWKILSYECTKGKVTGVVIDLDVSGGLPPYKYSPSLPIYALPDQNVTVKVISNTSDGEPSVAITFKVPGASDTSVYKCSSSGNDVRPPTVVVATDPSASIPPTSVPPTAVPPTAIPATPVQSTATLCWPPGKCK